MLNNFEFDPEKININKLEEIEYWSRELKISSAKLIKIVKKVGSSVKAVKAELERKKTLRKSNEVGRGY